jgi:hypothetical protein
VKYNHLFESRFQGCLHLAGYHDPNRKRDVKVFMVPGDHSVVGIWDGVDAWVAPSNTTVAGTDLVALLESVRNGTFAGAAAVKTYRRMIRLESPTQPASQGTAVAPETKPIRRRFIGV